MRLPQTNTELPKTGASTTATCNLQRHQYRAGNEDEQDHGRAACGSHARVLGLPMTGMGLTANSA